MKVDAVFEGGGVKIVGLTGALYYCEEEQHIVWQNLAGTSAGAVLAALVAAGYTAANIRDIIFQLDFNKIKDEGFFSQFSLPGKLISLLWDKGIYKGNFLETLVADLLAQKGVHTFGDLRIPGETDRRYIYRLNVIASDISRGKMLVLPLDLADYGLDPDRFSVARAVRMSAAIPFYFKPVIMPHRRNGTVQTSYIVDGGLLSNFPVWLFDADADPAWPTIGFRLTEPATGQGRVIHSIIDFLAAVVATMLEAHDQRYIEEHNFQRTVVIPTLGVQAIRFDITVQEKERLFQAGYDAAARFFQNFRAEQYRFLHSRFGRPNRFAGRRL